MYFFSGSHRHRSPQVTLLLLGTIAVLLSLLVLRSSLSTNAHPVAAAWQRAQQAEAYRFAAEVTQTVDPLPGVHTVGRPSKQDELYLEGHTNLRDETLWLRLWGGGGSVLVPESSTELRVEDGTTYARHGSGTWEEIHNVTGAFAPAGDFLTYLVNVRDVQRIGTETRAGVTFTRYAFTVNGPALAAHMRDRLQAQMSAQGKLAPGMQLDIPQSFASIQGTGELWVGTDGLPLRQILHLKFPEHNDEQVSAEMSIMFSDYAHLPIVAGWQSWAGQVSFALQEQVRMHLPAALAIVLIGCLALLLVVARRSRRLMVMLALLLCSIQIMQPLLQNLKAAEISTANAAERQEQEQQQQMTEAREEALHSHSQPSVDPHADPLAAIEPYMAGTTQSDDQVNVGLMQQNNTESEHLSVDLNIANPNGDDDGDGLTNIQEVLLGTNPDFADSDSDRLSDLAEVTGFLYGGRRWYTDPLEADTNRDTVADSDEVTIVNTTTIAAIDTDNDGIPNVFDTDDDADSVPDELDLAPLHSSQRSGRTFDADNPFTMQITDLQPDTPTLVDFQVRPTDPEHLWYAQNVLDWPIDRQGTIHDDDNATFRDTDPNSTNSRDADGDMRMLPMLEILVDTTSGAPSNLPLTNPDITVLVEPLPSSSGPSGSVRLEQVGSDLRATANLNGAFNAMRVVPGSCNDPSTGSAISRELTAGVTTVPGQTLRDLYIQMNDYRNHAIKVLNGTGDVISCGALPLISFDGEQMIATDLLSDYGAFTRPGNNAATETLVYVPLQLVTDPQTGERVAFSGRMFYRAGENWTRSHRVNMVWLIQTLTDACGEDDNDNGQCDSAEYTERNVIQLVHTYTDAWNLTGISVREDRGADLAIVYEDPVVDANLEDDLALHILANGLADTYLEGGAFDLSDIAARFDYTQNTTNGTTIEASWGLLERPEINVLRVVERPGYDYLDQLLSAVIMPMDGSNRGESLAILQDVFGNHTNIIPTLLFVRSELFRTVNLGDLDSAVFWSNNNLTLTLPTNGPNTVPEQEVRTVNWTPYAYDATTAMWQSVPLAEYWSELEQRYPANTFPTLDDDPTNDTNERLGLLMMTRFFYAIYNQGLQNLVRVDNTLLNMSASNESVINTVRVGAGVASTLVGLVLSETMSIPDIITELPEIGDTVSEVAEPVSSGSFASLKNWVSQHKALAATIAVGGLVLVALIGIVTAIIVSESSATDSGSSFFAQARDFFEPFTDFLASETGVILRFIADLVFAITTQISSVVSALRTIGNIFSGVETVSGVLSSADTAKSFKAGVITTIIMTAILVVAVAIILALTVVSQNIAPGSVVFSQLIASAIANILAMVILAVIALIPIIGPIITFVTSIIDLFLGFFGVTTFSEVLTNITLRAFYGNIQMVNIEPAVRAGSFFLQPEDQQLGLAVGNTLRVGQTMRTTVRHRSPDSEEWQAFLYFFLYGEGNMRSTFVDYSLTTGTDEMLTGSRNQIRNEWMDVQRTRPFFVDTHGYEGSIDHPLELGSVPLTTAGINQPVPATLNYVFVSPALECWTVPIPIPLPPFYIPYPVCRERSSDPVNGANDLGADLQLDVFPATVGEFADLRTTSRGGWRLAWDRRFPTLPDADNDGLRSPALNGNDPDDSTWDTDGDGLSDLLEAEGRENGMALNLTSPDTDGDGLTDRQELVFGSDPADRDTDNDGLLDRDEVYHQVLVEYSGQDVPMYEWTGGWDVLIDPARDLRVRVSSNPALPDTDNDGILDSLEKVLREQGYHPQVYNPNPVSITNEILDADGFIGRGDGVTIVNRVQNTRPSVFMEGRIQIDLPVGLGGGAVTEDVSLATLEQQAFTHTLTVQNDAASQRADIRSLVQANADRELSSSWVMQLDAGTPRTPSAIFTQAPRSASIAPIVNRRNEYVVVGQTSSNGNLVEQPGGTNGGSGNLFISTPSLPGGFTPSTDEVHPQGPPRADVACNSSNVCLAVWSESVDDQAERYDPVAIKGSFFRPIGNSFIDREFVIASFPPVPNGSPDLNGDYILPTVASDGDNFMVAFVRKFPGSTGQTQIWARAASPTLGLGTLQQIATTTSTSDLRFPDIAWNGDNYLLAFQEVGISATRHFVSVITLSRQTTEQARSNLFYNQGSGPVSNTIRPRIAGDPVSRRAILVYADGGSTGTGTFGVRARTYTNGRWSTTDRYIGFGVNPLVTNDPINNGWIVVLSNGGAHLEAHALDRNGNIRTTRSNGSISWYRHNSRLDLSCQFDAGRPLIDLPFEDAPGTTAFANTGTSGVAATCSGERCPAAGVLGRTPLSRGVSFSRNDVLVLDDTRSNDTLSLRGDMTLEAWVNPQDISGLHNILSFDAAGTVNVTLRINNGFYEVGTSNNYARFRIPEVDMRPGAWTYLVGTYTGNRWRLYRNGVEVDTHTTGVIPDTRARNAVWTVGATSSSSDIRPFIGNLDDVKLYDFARMADEISASFDDRNVSFCLAARQNETGQIQTAEIQLFEEREVLPPLTNESIAPLVIDATPPIADFALTEGAFLVGTGTVIIGGAASDDSNPADDLPGSGVNLVEVSINGGPWQPATGHEEWSFALPTNTLPESEITLQVRATDNVGLTGPNTPIAVNLDRTPPLASITTAANSTVRAFRTESPDLTGNRGWGTRLQGTSNDPAGSGGTTSGVEQVDVLLTSTSDVESNAAQTTTPASDGDWSLMYQLPDTANPTGRYTVEARARDVAGKLQAETTVPTITLNIDNTAPVATLDTIGNVANTTANTTTIAVITRSLTLSGHITDTGNVSTGVAGLEWALVPFERAEHLATLRNATLLDLPFDGSLPYALEDVSGRNQHSFCAGDTCPQPTDGRVGTAQMFDGVDDFLNVGNSEAFRFADTGAVSFTLSTWIKPDAQDDIAVILNREGEYELGIFPDGSLRWAMSVDDPNWRWIDTGIVPPQGEWTHVLFTYDDAAPVNESVKVYINGRLVATQAGEGPLGDRHPEANELYLGNRHLFSNPFAGALDEVKIFGRALTPEEVAALVEDSDRFWAPATLADTGSNVAATTWTATIPEDVEGFYQIDLRGTDVLGNRNEDRLTWNQWRGEIDTRAPQVQLGSAFTVFEDDILNLPFEGNAATVFSDTSPLGNDAMCFTNTCPTLAMSGPVSPSLTFDGVDDALVVGDQSSLEADGRLTMSAWVYPTGAPTNGNSIIIARESEYQLTLFPDNTLRWALALPNPGWRWIDTGIVIPRNQWSHVALTYDDSLPAAEAVKVYLNGQLAATQIGDGLIGDVNTTLNQLQIGNRQAFNTPFTGQIDEAGVFNRALTATEVETFYNNALSGSGDLFPADAAVFYLSAQSVPATAFLDVSGQEHNATCNTVAGTCPTLVTNGPSGQGLRFDGVDDALVVGDQASLEADDRLTMSAWVYPTGAPANANSIIIAKESEYQLTLFPDDTLRWSLALPNPGWRWINTGIVIPRNQWSHVALTYDDSLPAAEAVKVYLNGQLVATQTGDGSIGDVNATLNELQIGNRQAFDTPFTGRIDQVTIFTRTLTSAEVQALHIAVGGQGIPPRYLCRVQDLNLVEDSYACVTVGDASGVQNSTRSFYNTRLWQDLADEAGTERLIALEQALQVGFDPAPQIVACDRYGRCSEADTSLLPLPPFDPIGAPPGEPVPAVAPQLAAVPAATLAQQDTPPVAVALRAPGAGSVFTTTAPISITGTAVAAATLATLTFHANDTIIESFDLRGIYGDSRSTHTQDLTWTPPGDGLYGLYLTAQDSNGALVTSQPITIAVDTAPPTVLIATDVLSGFGRGPTRATPFMVRGSASDAARLRTVEVRVNDSPWLPALRDGDIWAASVQPFVPLTFSTSTSTGAGRVVSPDGETITLTARATDVAGRTTQATRDILVDLAAPRPGAITFAVQEGSGTRTLEAGDVVRTAPATLVIEWEASNDSSGLLDYAAGWTADATLQLDNIPTQGPIPGLTSYTPAVPRRHTQQVGEAEVRYAHLVIRDIYGNAHIETFGPIYVDSATTPDLLAHDTAGTLAQAGADRPDALLKDYDGWLNSGCTLAGESQPLSPSMSQSTRAATQRFYTTWDANGLRLAWEGAHWQGDGDLFLYADSTSGGSETAFSPYDTRLSDSRVLYLPTILRSAAQSARLGSPTVAQNNEGSEGTDRPGNTGRIVLKPSNITLPFAADTLVWIESANEVRLLHWNTISDTWVLDESFPMHDYVWYETATRRTNAYIPFAALGIDNPDQSPLRLIALASEENAMHLWATMPPGNPINSPRTINPYLASTLADSLFTLRHFYQWDTLSAGQCPSTNQLTSMDISLDVTADPPGMMYSFLGDDLFYMQDELFNNRDINSERILFARANFRPVPLNQEIVYTAHYANTGSTTSPNARLQVVAWPPLRLPDGERITDPDLGPFDQQFITLGDLAPGATGTVTIRARMDASEDDGVLLKASLDIVLLDARVVAQTPLIPLEWFWADHLIDRSPPDIAITMPQTFVQPGTLTMRGTVSDPGGIRAITLEQRTSDGTVTEHRCEGDAVEGAFWECPLPLRTTANGAAFEVRARATDAYQQTSEWTEWRLFTIDTTPPQLTFTPGSEGVLTDFFNPPNTVLAGSIVDTGSATLLEVCRTLLDTVAVPRCEWQPVAASDTPTATWALHLQSPEHIEGQREELAIIGIDEAGNRSTTPLTATYQLDTIPPVVVATQQRTSIPLAEGSNPNTIPTSVLQGTVSDGSAVAVVRVIVTQPDGTAFVSHVDYNRETGAWAYVLLPSVAGTHILRVEAEDGAGNRSHTESWRVNVTE